MARASRFFMVFSLLSSYPDLQYRLCVSLLSNADEDLGATLTQALSQREREFLPQLYKDISRCYNQSGARGRIAETSL
jgi:hypothetical protein